MSIWSTELKELERLNESLTGHFPELEKETGQLLKTGDENVAMLYSRRCLEVIVTDLCETELKRPRKTEPLKGIIDKINKEEKVPSYIITSMHGLNSLSTYGAHPKDFDPDQVKPALSNLAIIMKWYLRYKGIEILIEPSSVEEEAITGDGKQITDVTKLEKSVAVLPFINDSPDQENTYFINGVMEEILNNLQKIKDLRVISRTSVEQYRNQTKPLPEIAKELDVNYIVEGSGQKYGNSFRLRTQLIMAAKETHLWGESYQKKMNNAEDIFNVQIQIAKSIAAELKAVIAPEEKQLIEKIPTADLEAYDAYLKGYHYWDDLSLESLNKALEYLNLAIEKDPDFAPPYAGIAQVWVGLAQTGFAAPEVAGPKIYENINKALELDPDFTDSHFVNGIIAVWTEWDWEKGEKEFLKALELNPNDVMSRIYYAHLLVILKRYDEAHFHSQMAFELDPMNPLVMTLSANVDYNGRIQQSLEKIKKTLEIDPENHFALLSFADASYFNGDYKNSIETELKTWPGLDDEAREDIMAVFKDKGYVEAINTLLTYAEEYARTNYMGPIIMGKYYYRVGNLDKAIEYYIKGYEIHDPMMPYFTCPMYGFDDIRDDPRIIPIVEKMNLPFTAPN